MTSETHIEAELGYLPTNKRDCFWFAEGICAGATAVLIAIVLVIWIGPTL